MGQERTLTKKERFVEYLGRSAGSISAICEAIGVSRQTYYHWCRDDPQFAEASDQARTNLNEAVEDMLLEKIFLERDGASIRYYLDRRHPAYDAQNKAWTQALEI
jgi:transposase-like protein